MGVDVEATDFSVPIQEESWVINDGRHAIREDLLSTLTNLDKILIRANSLESSELRRWVWKESSFALK